MPFDFLFVLFHYADAIRVFFFDAFLPDFSLISLRLMIAAADAAAFACFRPFRHFLPLC